MYLIFLRKRFYRKSPGILSLSIKAINTDNGSEYLLNFTRKLCLGYSTSLPIHIVLSKTAGWKDCIKQQNMNTLITNTICLMTLMRLTNTVCYLTRNTTLKDSIGLGYKRPAEYVNITKAKKGGQPFSI